MSNVGSQKRVRRPSNFKGMSKVLKLYSYRTKKREAETILYVEKKNLEQIGILRRILAEKYLFLAIECYSRNFFTFKNMAARTFLERFHSSNNNQFKFLIFSFNFESIYGRHLKLMKASTFKVWVLSRG